jgi:Flp pilus assembly protein TadD
VASNLLALSYERSGRAADAIAILEAIRRNDPRDLPTILNLAGIHLRSGDPGAAVPLLRKAREISPRNLQALVNLIVALGRSGDLEGARAEFRAAGETASQRPDVLNALAYACWLGGRPAEAKDLLHRSLERRRDQPEALRLLETIESPSSAPPAVSERAPGL